LLADVSWAGAGAQFYAQTRIDSPGSGVGAGSFSVLGSDQVTGRIDDQPINASRFVQNALDTTATIYWQIWAYAIASDGLGYGPTALVDASNTGTIFFSASEGLSVVPTTPGFLANASYPSDVAPVPLPASGLLLLGGLGAAALRRRRRPSAST
jgi:hypothetical protein